MAIAKDASSPAVATSTSTTVATVTSASFTPPSNSIVVAGWGGNTGGGVNPSAPSITDNLGAHLTWTLVDWVSRADTGADGQCALWWAKVTTSAAMTVTVTTGTASGNRQQALEIRVYTGVDTTTPIASHSKAADSGGALDSPSYTSTVANSQGVLMASDWDVSSTTFTANAASNLELSSTCGGNTNVAFLSQKTQTTSGSTIAMGLSSPTSTTWNYAQAELRPSAGATTPPVSMVLGQSSVPTPALSTGSTVSAAMVLAQSSVPTPVVKTGATVSVSTVVAQTSIPTPTVAIVAGVSATAVLAQSSVPTPTVSAGSTKTATMVLGQASVPTPVISTSVNVTVSAVVAQSSVPAVTVSAPGASQHTGFADAASANLVYGNDPAAVNVATGFYAFGRTDITAVGLRIYVAAGAGAGGTGIIGYLMDSSSGGTTPNRILETKAFGTVSTATWTSVTFDTSHAMADGKIFWVAVYFPNGEYSFWSGQFGTPTVFNDLSGVYLASNAELSSGNGSYAYGSAGTFPTTTGSGAWYGIDPIVTVGSSPDASVHTSTVVGQSVIPAPGLSTSSSLTTSVVVAQSSVPAVTVTTTGNATVLASVVIGQSSIPAPAVSGGGTNATATPATVVAQAVIPTLVGNAASTITTGVVLAQSSVPAVAPGIASNATVTTATVVAQVSVPTPLVATLPRPAVVTAQVSIPTPTITAGAGVSVSVATVVAQATVASLVVLGGSTGTWSTWDGTSEHTLTVDGWFNGVSIVSISMVGIWNGSVIV